MADVTPTAITNETPYKVLGSDTNGAYSILEVTTLPGEGPPVHSHAKEDEGFYVLEGTFRFWIGDADPVDVYAGAHVFSPRNVFHKFQNVSEVPGKMLLVFTPAGCEQYFVDLAEVRQRLKDAELLEAEEGIDRKYGITINRRV